MNIDILNGTGVPVSNPGLPYYRFAFNVSQSDPNRPHSNQNLSIAYQRYDPVINRLRTYGASLMMVLTHQTYGEGAGYDWSNMAPDRWQQWITGMAQFAGQTAAHFKGRIKWYQIGNEHDKGSEAAIYIPPNVYGSLFRTVSAAIRANDPAAKIITAGMVSGAISGSNYLRNAGVMQLADGLAFHAYGQDLTKNPQFGQEGTLTVFLHETRAWAKPVHITEWGALDHEGRTSVEDVAAYARRFMAACQGKVETAHWFAWGRQHNAFAVSPAPGQIREPLLAALRGAAAPPDTPPPAPLPASGLYALTGIPNRLNMRASHSLSAPVLMTLGNGDQIEITGETVNEGVYRWRKIRRGGIDGWIAVSGGGLSIGVRL